MKIRSVLLLSSILLIGTLLLFITLLFRSFRNVALARSNNDITRIIVERVTELRLLTFEYILNPNTRIVTQWESTYQNLYEQIPKIVVETENETILKNELSTSLQAIDATFHNLIPNGNQETNNTASTSNAQQQKTNLLLIQTQSLITDVLKLAGLVENRLQQSEQWVGLFIVVFLFINFCITVAVLFLFYRRMLKPLAQLQHGMSIVSKGDLNHTLEVKGKDEFSEVAEQFNSMVIKLKELDWAKSQFLIITAHQLRTPLGVMRWNLELLRSEKVGNIPPLAKEYIRIISEHLLNLISIVGEFLSTERIEQRQLNAFPTKFNAIDVIEKVIKKLKMQAEDHRVTFTLKNHGEKGFDLMLDRGQFETVMENILVNAILYSRTGGSVEIDLDASPRDITIKVRDHGIGIPTTEKAHIFSKFYRAQNAILTHPNSSGLGLFIVKTFVDSWGGTVHLDSTEGKGTIITLRIPKDQG